MALEYMKHAQVIHGFAMKVNKCDICFCFDLDVDCILFHESPLVMVVGLITPKTFTNGTLISSYSEHLNQ